MQNFELEVTEFWAAPKAQPPLRKQAPDAPATPGSAPAARGTALALDDVGKSFGTRRVLDGIGLRVEPGEFIAIVGRSGCGKSTLLRLLAGLETLGTGRIALDGEARYDAAGSVKSIERADLRVMFQDARLLPWKRVLDNVALGLEGADAKARALEALGQVGLAERANEWPAVLSGGQRQRVALARALVHAPRLLLLDEPLGALDALTRIEMQALIERLWRQHGFTAALVTHDVGEAVALADRVLLIEDGRIALDERIALPRPRSRGDAAYAALEERILNRVLQKPDPTHGPDATAGPADPFAAWPSQAHELRWAV
jgi:sulfonate transport system ATP-binding protein